MTTALARLLVPAATLALTACLALADAPERRGGSEKLHAKFAAADADHDGYLSRAEAEAGMPRVAKHFDEIDTNHDGKLSFAEIASYLAAARTQRQD